MLETLWDFLTPENFPVFLYVFPGERQVVEFEHWVQCMPPGQSGLSDPDMRALTVFASTYIVMELVYEARFLKITNS